MEVGVTKLVNGLDHGRIASAIFTSCPCVDSLRDRLHADVPLVEFNRQAGNDPRFVLQLYRAIRRARPDILHTHGWATLVEGYVAGRLAGVPIIVHGEHGTLQTGFRHVVTQRAFWPRVDRVLAVSSRLADRMATEVGFPRDRIQVLRNGVDLERFDPRHRSIGRARLGVGPNDLLIGTAGRLVPVKDHATLLHAYARLRAAGVPFIGVITGTGPLLSELHAIADTLGLDNVKFLGARDDIEYILPALDIFVLSSVSEGLSNTIQEAMASGAAVVATHVGGADELVQVDATGLLVPASSPVEMASALLTLARDRERRRAMGAAGRHRAETQFDLRQTVTRYQDLYLDLFTRGRTPID